MNTIKKTGCILIAAINLIAIIILQNISTTLIAIHLLLVTIMLSVYVYYEHIEIGVEEKSES